MPEATQQSGGAAEVDRIVRAAREALGRAGYENLKVKSVIRSAGVSVGSFYRRFRGKQDLMLALVADEARRNTRFLTKVTADGTPPERVLAWVDSLSIRALCAVAGTDQAGWFGDSREEVVTHVARFVMAALTNPVPRMPPSSDTGHLLDT
jgi:AcrR family transcriptional regulator